MYTVTEDLKALRVQHMNGRKLFKAEREWDGCSDGDKNSHRVVNAGEEERLLG